MNLRNLPFVLAGLIVTISVLLVVVGDSNFISVDQFSNDNDKIIVRSP